MCSILAFIRRACLKEFLSFGMVVGQNETGWRVITLNGKAKSARGLAQSKTLRLVSASDRLIPAQWADTVAPRVTLHP